MQYLLEHLAIYVSAMSGVLAARGKRIDLFGVVVLGVVTALGGGTIRDVILDLRPVLFMQWARTQTRLSTTLVPKATWVALQALQRSLKLSDKPQRG